MADTLSEKLFFPLSVTQIDVEKCKSGVLAGCKELTPELVLDVAQRWAGGPLKGLPKRLGHFLKLVDGETGKSGNYPLSGYHHYKRLVSLVPGKWLEDCRPNEVIAEWVDNTPRNGGDSLGMKLGQLRYEYEDDRDHPTIYPLPLEDLILHRENQIKMEEEVEQRAANREAEKEKIRRMAQRFSGGVSNDDGGNRDEQGPPQGRRDKFSFQGSRGGRRGR